MGVFNVVKMTRIKSEFWYFENAFNIWIRKKNEANMNNLNKRCETFIVALNEKTGTIVFFFLAKAHKHIVKPIFLTVKRLF